MVMYMYIMVCALDSRWCHVYLVGYSVDLQYMYMYMHVHYMHAGMKEHLQQFYLL